MNPMALMKIMQMKNQFTTQHPKFEAFLKKIFSNGLEEGTVFEITVTRPGETPITSNIRLTQSDMEMFEELKKLGMQK